MTGLITVSDSLARVLLFDCVGAFELPLILKYIKSHITQLHQQDTEYLLQEFSMF